MEELTERLGFNGHRLGLIDGLAGIIDWLNGMPPIESLIIDGSFVTDKDLPDDIDAVAMITNLTEHNQRHWVRTWQPQRAGLKQQYGVDLYPTVIGQGNIFAAYFQYIRPEEAMTRGAPLGVLKGILRMAR